MRLGDDRQIILWDAVGTFEVDFIEISFIFQACTGIEDVAQAIYHLEETNWDLVVSNDSFVYTFV